MRLSDRVTLSATLQSTLLASFDAHTDALNARLERIRKRAGVVAEEVEAGCGGGSGCFSPARLINAQFALCRFYWSLGLLESALHELDEMDAFLSGQIWELASASSGRNFTIKC